MGQGRGADLLVSEFVLFELGLEGVHVSQGLFTCLVGLLNQLETQGNSKKPSERNKTSISSEPAKMEIFKE